MGAGEEERWPPHAMVACWERVPLARILMDGTGGTGVSASAAERAWRPSPSPLAPFLSRAAGEEGGMVGPHRSPLSPVVSPRGEEGGW